MTRMLTIFAFLSTLFSCTERKPVFENAPALHYSFQRIGPGGGGSTYIPTYSYYDPKTFLLRCDMTGAYLTHDGGEHYEQFNFPGGVSAFAWDPLDSLRIWAGSTVLQRSVDGGKHWALIFPVPGVDPEIRFEGDHAEPVFMVKGVKYSARVSSITLDPAKRGDYYFGYGDLLYHMNESSEVLHEQDLGEPVLGIFPEPNSVCVFTANAVWTLDRASRKMEKVALQEGMVPLTRVARGSAAHGRRERWYAVGGSGNQLWMSGDGRAWKPNAGTRAMNLSAVACSAEDADRAYLVVDRFGGKEGDGKPAWSGVMTTTDGGAHWSWSLKQGGGKNEYAIQDGQTPDNLVDAWAGEAFGKEYVAFLDAGVDPKDGRYAVVTDWYRVLKTDDGGVTWSSAYSSSKHDGSSVSGGLDVTTCYRVHIDPFDPKHIAVSYTDIGFQHSFDGGGSWVRSCAGVPRDWNNTCYDVVFDPKVKGRLWSAWSGTHDIPRGKMTRNPKWRSTVKGGVCISDDGGKTWTPVLNGMGDDNAVTSLLMDPNSSPGHRVLYAAVYNKGVFRSDDDGHSWSQINNGIDPNTATFALALDAKGRLFVTVCPNPDHRADGNTKGILPGAVYRSDDKGQHWFALNVQNDPIFPVGITSDPNDPNRLYLSCWGDISPDDQLGKAKAKKLGLSGTLGFKGGVMVSVDGGDHWGRIGPSEWYAYDISVDPFRSGRIYANTFNLGAWYSDDRGAHWGKIEGYDFAWGHRVMPDPGDSNSIYITTYGSGVWRGRLEPVGSGR